MEILMWTQEQYEDCYGLSAGGLKELAGWVEHAIEHFPEVDEDNEETYAALRHIANLAGVYFPARRVK
jgi:hypothetical protein